MAIQGTIKTRTGLEADFDPYKMIAGEWAVSTDMKYVRMCFAPGVCYRMATYEAFEEDMIVIERILKETQDIQEAVEKIRIELNGKAELVAEDVQTAKEYMDQAEEYMNKAKEYADLSGALTGTQIAQKDLLGVVKGGDVEVDEDGSLRHFKRGSGNVFAIANTYEAPLSDIKLYGKSEQFSTSGKNLLKNEVISRVVKDVTFTVNADGSVTINGTATATADFYVLGGWNDTVNNLPVNNCTIIASGTGTSNIHLHIVANQTAIAGSLTGDDIRFSIDESGVAAVFYRVQAGITVSNVTVYPMIRLASITDGTYEPYTGGIPSPNPEYPQPIVSVGEKLASGRQLFDKSNVFDGYVANGGIVTSAHADYYRSDYIPVSGSSVTISGHTMGYVGGSVGMVGLDADKNVIVSSNTTVMDISNCAYVCISVPKADIDTLMLNSGSTPLPWEPYTGGKKAAYEMGIGNVVSGANLLDMTGANSGKTNNGITAVVNEDGSYTVSGTATENIINIWFLGNYGDNMPVLFTLPAGTYYAKDIVLFNDKQYVSGATDAVFTITEETAITGVRCKQLSKGTTYSNVTFYPMINLGSEPLSWEPYTNQSHTLNRTLRAIPVTDASLANYTDADGQMWCADTIEEVNGKMCLVERIKRRIYGADGRSVKYANTNGVVYAIMQYNNPHDVYMETNGTMIAQGTTMLSNRGSYITWEQGDSGAIGVNYVNNAMRIYFGVTDEITSNDDVLALMTGWDEAGDSFYVDYILTTPIITPLTDEEISAIESLHSYYPVTTVMGDAWTEVECATSNVAAYVLSNKKEIDAVVAEIGTADISSIGDGTVKGAIKEHDSKFLPLTGGTLTGNTRLEKSIPAFTLKNTDNNIEAQMYADSEKNVYFRSIEEGSYSGFKILPFTTANTNNLFKAYASNGEWYIFGEHNKPTGSYTGNGSATKRTIDIGGIGGAIAIQATNGISAFVTTCGAITGLTGSEASTCNHFRRVTISSMTSPNLVIEGCFDIFNASGVTYYYRVL